MICDDIQQQENKPTRLNESEIQGSHKQGPISKGDNK